MSRFLISFFVSKYAYFFSTDPFIFPLVVTDLWAAIASDVGAMLLVTINAMLLLPKKLPREAAVSGPKEDVEQGKPGAAISQTNKRPQSRDSEQVGIAVKDVKSCTKNCCGDHATTGKAPVETKGGAKKCCEDHDHKHLHDLPHKDVSSKGCCSSSSCTKNNNANHEHSQPLSNKHHNHSHH